MSLLSARERDGLRCRITRRSRPTVPLCRRNPGTFAAQDDAARDGSHRFSSRVTQRVVGGRRLLRVVVPIPALARPAALPRGKRRAELEALTKRGTAPAVPGDARVTLCGALKTSRAGSCGRDAFARRVTPHMTGHVTLLRSAPGTAHVSVPRDAFAPHVTPPVTAHVTLSVVRLAPRMWVSRVTLFSVPRDAARDGPRDAFA